MNVSVEPWIPEAPTTLWQVTVEGSVHGDFRFAYREDDGHVDDPSCALSEWQIRTAEGLAEERVPLLIAEYSAVHLRDHRLRVNAGMDFPACKVTAALDLDACHLKMTGLLSKVTCSECRALSHQPGEPT